MYIHNPSPLLNTYKCNKRIAKYLQSKEIPLLSNEDGIFYFSETEKLKEELLKLPFYLKWFS